MDPLREAARRDSGALALTGALIAPPSSPPAPNPSAEVSRSSTSGGTRSWTFGELDAWADAVALRLQGMGIGPGALVAFRLPPSPEAVVLLHAIPRAGGVLIPLHPSLTPAEERRALGALPGVNLLLVSPSSESGPPEVPTLPVDEVTGATPAPTGGFGMAVGDPDPDTPLALLLTSGSTGAPRPIPLTRGNLEASALGVSRRLRLDASDVWLTTLSPAHVGGLTLLHRGAMTGCALRTLPRFDAAQVADLMEAGEFTHASLVPVMLQRLLEVWGDRPPPRRVRALVLGGAALPEPLLRRALDARFPIALTYGLTEATSQVATAPPVEVREKPGSVGPPLSGLELRLADPDAEGVGEIQVRGATVVPLPPSREGVGVGFDGWLRTGDVGRIDEDGDLWIVGRRSDRIISGGVTVEPAEVENALLALPGVREVAVVGLPDEEWGERVAAVLVPSSLSADPLTVEALDRWAREELAPAKRPRVWVIRDELPRTATGKVDRPALRLRLRNEEEG